MSAAAAEGGAGPAFHVPLEAGPRGFGLHVEQRGDRLLIGRLNGDQALSASGMGPAARTRLLRAGDWVQAIDGLPVNALGFDAAVRQLAKPEAGARLVLTVARPQAGRDGGWGDGVADAPAIAASEHMSASARWALELHRHESDRQREWRYRRTVPASHVNEFAKSLYSALGDRLPSLTKLVLVTEARSPHAHFCCELCQPERGRAQPAFDRRRWLISFCDGAAAPVRQLGLISSHRLVFEAAHWTFVALVTRVYGWADGDRVDAGPADAARGGVPQPSLLMEPSFVRELVAFSNDLKQRRKGEDGPQGTQGQG